MKSFVLSLAILVASVAWSVETAFPFPEYEGPRAKYLEAIEKIRASQKPGLAPLNATYAQRLEALVKTMVAGGDEPGAAAVRAEQERLKRGAEPSKEERDAMPGLLRVQRTSYEKERMMVAVDEKLEAPADAAWAVEVEKLYYKLIHPLQTDRFAKQKAAIARAEMERLAVKASPALKPLFPPVAGVTPPATQPESSTTTTPEASKPHYFPPTEEARKVATELVAKLKLVNPTAVTEAAETLASAVSRDLKLLKDVTEVTLLRTHDATEKPMITTSASPVELRGSHAKKVLLGTTSSVMLYGPFEHMEPGRYLVVFRFKFRGEIKNQHGCYLDIAHETKSIATVQPRATATPTNEWVEVAVPLKMTKARDLEYRVWPRTNEMAVDRIYIYKLEGPTAETAKTSTPGANG